MPADGFASRFKLHDAGVYLDLPMRDYVNDPALSGSGIKKLLTSPPDWRFEQPDNDLYDAPETDDQALGTLVHTAVLEGVETFNARYVVKPDPDSVRGVLRTQDDMAAWLKDRGQPHSGSKAKQVERIQAHWNVLKVTGAASDQDEPIFWDAFLEELCAGGKELIKAKDDRYVRLVHGFVSAWPEAQKVLTGGLAEVSMFWVEGDVRYKARFDYLTALAEIERNRDFRGWKGPLVLDAKKFGRAPRRGHALWQHLQSEALKYDYDLQAVHNRRAAMMPPLLLAQSDCILSAVGENATQRLDKLQEIAAAVQATPPLFAWLWLRTPGPPQGLIMPFEDSTKRWAHAESDVEEAITNYRTYREQCGDGLWIEAGVVPFDDEEVPPYAWEIPRR
jgi:hypothetical protein